MRVVCEGVDEGHRACRACLTQVMSGNLRCPTCNVRCEPGAKDGALERQMKPLEVKCDCCEWSGPWGDRIEHIAVCDNAAGRLGWKCPVEACHFTADTEREVEIHLLAGFQEHLELARPAAAAPPKHPSFGCKDTAQVYIASLAAFHASGERISSPQFVAAGGYVCLMTVSSGEHESVKVALRFCPKVCDPDYAPFPFSRPFIVSIVDPDHQSKCTTRQTKFHLTLETRHSDSNICPPATQASWTAGITRSFTREEIWALNRCHIIVKLYVT